MENTVQWIPVARVQDAHGIRGELYFRFRTKESDWYRNRDEIRLICSGQPIRTLKIKQLRLHKEGAIVAVEGLEDRTAAEQLKGCFWEIPATDLVSQPGDNIYLKEILGFTVQAEGQGEIGQVIGFTFNGAQDLLDVKGPNRSYDIPFIEEFIVNINYESQVIEMQLPEGLLDL